jgi:hypothetical protein
MLVLFDHSTPAPLRFALKAHTVVEAVERGWETLANGALPQEAEAAGFEVFITADKNIRYQQNLTRRRIAILVLENAMADLAPARRPCRLAGELLFYFGVTM